MDSRIVQESFNLVSIITPVYNSAPFLRDTIDSVIAQTYKNWELLLIIDAKSTDESDIIASQYSKYDERIKILKSATCFGVSRNRNLGIDASKGEFIAFLDSDDIWLPFKLEKQLKKMLMDRRPFSCHSYYCFRDDPKKIFQRRTLSKNISYQDLLIDNSIGCLTVMVQKHFLGSLRFENIRHEDYLLWLNLLKSGESALTIQEELACYRVGHNSLSRNKLKSAVWRWKIYSRLNISIIKSIFYMLYYAAYALKKRIIRCNP